MSERLVVGFYLACGAVLLFLSTIIWRESPKSRINRTTAFMLGFAGLGTIFSAVGYSLGPAALSPVGGTQPVLRNLHYVWELFFPCLLLFSLEFPFRHPRSGSSDDQIRNLPPHPLRPLRRLSVQDGSGGPVRSAGAAHASY